MSTRSRRTASKQSPNRNEQENRSESIGPLTAARLDEFTKLTARYMRGEHLSSVSQKELLDAINIDASQPFSTKQAKGV